jgi:hypothetical protein
MEHKQVEAYASEECLLSASTCADCGAVYEVLIDAIDVAKQTAIARIQVTHQGWCEALWNHGEVGSMAGRSARCVAEEVETAGWG